jgi:amino acid adenylation domain-containing protein
LAQRLQSLARHYEAPLSAVLLTGWAALVSRWRGLEEVVFGAQLAEHRALRLQITVPAELSASALLSIVREALSSAMEHADAPLENSLADAGRGGSLDLELSLAIREIDGHIAGALEYSADSFDSETVARMLASWERLLAALASDPNCPIGRLPILTVAERDRVVYGFNDTACAYPERNLMHELFEDQVTRAPDNTALLHEEDRLSFGQVNRRANRLARVLRSRGVAPDDLVGLAVERGFDMVIGMLAILKAGGAYVPIDPAYPAERIAHMLREAVPRFLLTQRHLEEQLPASPSEVILIDADWSALDDGNVSPRDVGLTPGHLAFVIYTSGSTGAPKGAMNEHRGMVNRIAAQRQIEAFGADDICCQKTSISFVDAVFEIFGALCNGLPLVILSAEAVSDSRKLAEQIAAARVTRLITVPSLARSMSGNDAIMRNLTGLRTWTLSGEEVSPGLVRELQRQLPACEFIDQYGSSEVSSDAACYRMHRFEGSRVPIGRPVPNCTVYILDRQRAPVPIGVVGEIFVGGVGVGRGYHKRADLTAERFLPDPFSARAGARLYATGDLGRWRADGLLECLGRNDRQVKIRGFRIELGEIEAQLRRNVCVADAVVVARDDLAGDRRLVAYVTPRDARSQAAHLPAELREELKQILPAYMVPAAIVVLEHLPLTPNGKIDRRALPAPERAAFATREYAPAQSESEIALASIWQELLGLARVGRHDHFFELGGHSLLLVQMMERLRSRGWATDASTVYRHPILGELARALSRDVAAEHDVPPNLIPRGCERITADMLPLVRLDAEQIERIVRAVPGGAANIQDIYPLTPLQEGMLFHHLLDEHAGDTYVEATLLSLASRERLEELIAALQGVIDRHEILRTAVLWEGLPRPVQVVYREATLPTEEVELTASELLEPRRQQLDLRSAPLLRLQIARGERRDHWYALLQLHHMVDDDTSIKILIAEVLAHLEGRAHELPLPVPYRNHVARALEHAARSDAEAFFRAKLGDVEEPTAPYGLLDVHGDGGRLAEARLEVDSPLIRQARAHARRLGVSVATLFHAAWGLVVAHTSARDDIVFGSVLLGRLQSSAGAKQTVGMFVNTLPLRLQLAALGARELIEHTRRALVELLSYEQSSLVMAQRCSGVGGQAPLFSAMLNYRHSAVEPEAEWARAAGIHVVASQYRTNYPVSMSVDDSGERIALTAHTHRRVDPQRMNLYLQTALQSLVTALEQTPDAEALQLAVVPEREREQMLVSFNATAAPYPHERLIHELFAERVASTPEKPAVICEAESLTFADLDRRANQLAHHLRALQVGPDRPVGICVERSIEMVVGILGILKAGGAYVPLDPSYPPERLAHMLNAAAPQVLLIHERLRKRLPETAAAVVALDADWPLIAAHPGDAPDVRGAGLRSHHIAYVIFTSGSTGQPKGVMVEHRNVVNLWQSLHEVYRASAPCERIAVNASFTFDASVKQIIQLLSGRTLVVVPQEIRWDASRLLAYLALHRVHGIDCTPSQLKSWLAEGLLQRGRSPLRVVLVGGEPIDPDLWGELARSAEIDFYNVYGPTECTVDATAARLKGDAGPPHIGRPMENKRIYILDRRGALAPLGVAGEIYIGGAGVARGYLNHPQLTAERFSRDPFSSDPDARIYKSGDLGRWRADGSIEYVGRNDHQVKVRGFRIELGEIEAQLLQHPQVRQAVVLARADEWGEKRLVAYVCADAAHLKDTQQQESAAQAGADMVTQWNEVHDATYATGVSGPSFVGWNSSYTGEPIPESEMREWLDCTVERILQLSPRRVLEIGCGVGLVLQHVAPRCEAYVGTDFSATALDQLRQWIAGRADLAHVELMHRAATDFDDLAAGSFDAVVLNSVVQYFPDVEYLLEVLRGAARLVGEGGKIFIGDVRDMRLLPTFHSAVQLTKSAANVTVRQLRKRIARALAQEKELVIDPQLFHVLPQRLAGVAAAEVRWKKGRALNELTRYRYDVVLHAGAKPLHIHTTPESRAILDVRLTRDAAAERFIRTADEHVDASTLRNRLNELAPADVTRLPAGSDAWAIAPRPEEVKPWSAYTTDPLENGLSQQMIPRLREHLKGRVPEYMMPSAWLMLKSLPLTPNGKVDRRALPDPQGRPEELGEYVAPRTDLERTLTEIWAQVLQVDQVGIEDHFFEIGGHSLLAMQVLVRLRSALSIEMPMSVLFELPTIRELAAHVEEARQVQLLDDLEGTDHMSELLDAVASMPDSEVEAAMRQLQTRERA